MGEKSEAALWRLLEDLEDLIEQEAFVIKQYSFDELGKVLEKKETVIQGLVKASQESGINRKTNEEFGRRMDRVLGSQRDNSDELLHNMELVKQELQNNARAKGKLRGIKGTYGSMSAVVSSGQQAKHSV
ncbi:MAG: hypothetical protein COZ46_06135 [Verrucomicrobia bacterium CG_4_10_14_3_um_filter_43_23]|nr:MAG: hypothetical protein AUJ82_07855 [Verrucomicrobia bacterium CG1_02_43_26]PIP59351.1 MAG: hypothetical protein COX01_04070 [Verrucomicrobia bacterium CG22_combo_CG10-13_8_21_14_all_43_17]PIX57976.1 MAG: hypothetical protein COZ46_06135 [Verrucomicrobia bacterium CG_4_10_14_3_um_filter_43_23]PIY61627.1 MAG: hypothetical protein COY94_04410 [Verrucomicrobia bacterium CG_4_10_14_0_8_um_filter_43_34]PJA43988.1 MAG: hypothetical protein CO175_05250 [Verrucomicrobia bacterium CG_4_9_14_3_um_fi